VVYPFTQAKHHSVLDETTTQHCLGPGHRSTPDGRDTGGGGNREWLIFGLRATPDDEEMGIDEAEHAETAYDFASVGSGSALSMAGAGKEA
jgi:hypothetical protein